MPMARLLRLIERGVRTRRPRSVEVRVREGPLAGRWLHHRLVPLDDGAALITRDITEHKVAEAALAAQARVDSLTALLNRRGFEERLREALARAARSTQTLALFYLDLDGFKQINDRYGHAAGDRVLVEVARRLQAALRVTDTVSRLGGDEFTVILEGAGTVDQVQDLAQRVVDVLRAPHASTVGQAVATPSIGVALWRRGEEADALCARADAAMYAAKSAGKSRFVLDLEVAGAVRTAPDAAMETNGLVSLARALELPHRDSPRRCVRRASSSARRSGVRRHTHDATSDAGPPLLDRCIVPPIRRGGLSSPLSALGRFIQPEVLLQEALGPRQGRLLVVESLQVGLDDGPRRVADHRSHGGHVRHVAIVARRPACEGVEGALAMRPLLPSRVPVHDVPPR